MSSDAEPYHQQSGPTCGQRYEPEEGIYASTTKNVTWTPLLRKTTLGLNGIDSDKSTNVRIRAQTLANKPDGATIGVSTWYDTKFYWGSADVIGWGDCASTLEYGTLDTYEERKTSKKVTFERCYDAPPTVIVFFYYLDLLKEGDGYRVKAYAQDVTAKGFTVGATSWYTSKLYNAGVAWIAVPANSTTFRAGTYSTAELHHWTKPEQKHSKSLQFSSPLRDNPTVFTALNHIDMPNAQNLRIRLDQESLSGKGFTWHIDAWYDSKINQANAAYLAY